MRYNFLLIRLAKIRKFHNTLCWLGCREIGIFVPWWWECVLSQLLWRALNQGLLQMQMNISFQPIMPYLGFYHARKIMSLLLKTSPALSEIARSIENWFDKIWDSWKKNQNLLLFKASKMNLYQVTKMDLLKESQSLITWKKQQHVTINRVWEHTHIYYSVYEQSISGRKNTDCSWGGNTMATGRNCKAFQLTFLCHLNLSHIIHLKFF